MGQEAVYGQPRPGAARPGPAAPMPRPATPSMSRPAVANPAPAQRPQGQAFGTRPAVANPAPAPRPIPPRPVSPQAPMTRPNPPQGGGISRPATLPGMGAMAKPSPGPVTLPGNNAPMNRPAARPTLPVDRPTPNPSFPGLGTGINRPGSSVTGPGAINRPTAKPIGVAPTIPGGNRPGINIPNGPNLPGPGGISGNRPGLNLPGGIGGNRPGGNNPGGDRPPIVWPGRPGPGGDRPGINIGSGDRPSVNWKPGVNNNGGINTIVNNRPVNSNVFNQTSVSNFTSTNVNVNNFGGNTVIANRPGYGNYGGNGYGNYGYNQYLGAAAAGYGSAWANNYANWNRGYHHWYNGCYQGGGYNNWGLGVAGLGIGAWGLNSLALDFGYRPYVNPFYAPVIVNPAPVYLNYSQPIINVAQAVPENGAEPAKMPETATMLFDKATAVFRAGNYKEALSNVERAMRDFPKDVVMHEFRALCLFALRDYQQSSAAMHALLASGPGWDWTTLSSLYTDLDTYKSQLQALENDGARNPEDAARQFLLAYHQMTAGNDESARVSIRKAHALLPKDAVIDNLYRILRAAPANEPNAKNAEAAPQDSVKDFQLDITGEWKSDRDDGGAIVLTIKKDGGFAWEVNDKSGKKDSFEGIFTLEGPLLVLERSSGGALMGRIKALSERAFQFKVVGGSAEDSGLEFRK